MKSGGTEDQKSPVAVYGALAANAAIAVTKFAVASLSGSSALLSEAIHSTVDTANELLLLLGLRRAAAPATPAHPFGHGKEIYFWGLIVAMVIFAGGGAVSAYEGTLRLVHGHGSHDARLGWKLGVLGIAFLFEGISFTVALRSIERAIDEPIWRALRRSRDPSVYTVVAEDAAALAGLCVAAVGVVLAHVLDAPWIDATASIVIGAILCSVAVLLAVQSRSLIVGRGANRELVESIRAVAASVPGVRRAGTPLTMHLGTDDLLVNIDISIEAEARGAELAGTLEEIERRIRREHPIVGRVFIEIHLEDDQNRGSPQKDFALE